MLKHLVTGEHSRIKPLKHTGAQGHEMADTKRKKPAHLLLIFGAVSSAIALYSAVIYYYVDMQINDDRRINIIGRQRMLTQKIMKNILLYRDGGIGQMPIVKSVALFNATLIAVGRGGTVPEDESGANLIRISPMDSRESRRMMAAVAGEWEPFKASVARYLRDRDPASLQFLLDHNEKLLATVDAAVVSIQRHANSDGRMLRLLILSAVTVVAMSFGLVFVRYVRRYRSAEEMLSEIERLLPICAGCKRIRTDDNHPYDPKSWTSIEEYLRENKDMVFTHSLCPDCMMKYDPDRGGR
jgi:hypothetical protein